MDASTIQPRTDSLSTLTSSLLTKNLGNNEPAIETSSDNDQDDNSNISSGSVNLSDSSLKLSASSPVESSDQAAPIENQEQAQQALKQLIADFQSNPSKALGAQSSIFAESVKPLLGS
jgi:hypothetical protein